MRETDADIGGDMPYRTEYGKHYHETYGCHGATIPCDTKGLTPCSDCCGSQGGGTTAALPMGHRPVTEGASRSSGDTGGPRRRGKDRRIPNEAGCTYVGYFVDGQQMKELLDALDRQGVNRAGLSRAIACPHVTLSYMPDDVQRGSFGKTQRMRAVGYGNDGKNEGVKVELLGEAPDEAIAAMTKGVSCPHVTISVSADGKPVDTRNLDFQPLPHPIEFTGTYGGYHFKTHTAITTPPESVSASTSKVMPEGNGRGGAVDAMEILRPMENPEIPSDGLVSDVEGLAEEVRSSDGMLVVMRGSAGCGKSTVIDMMGENATVVCPDDIRVRLFGLEPDESGVMRIPQHDGSRVWALANRQVSQACAQPGAPVVVDAMHTRPRDIRQWQDIAGRTGRKLVVVDMTDIPREVAHERNAGRAEWKQVPDSVIDRFYDVAKRNTAAVRREYPCVDRMGFARLLRLVDKKG